MTEGILKKFGKKPYKVFNFINALRVVDNV